MELGHLATRFFGSLTARPLGADDAAWVVAQLLPGEWDLWARMNVADRAHAHRVARDVAACLGSGASRPVLAAALLHDVGKIESGLGTFGRVLATLAAKTGARRGVVGTYRAHNEIGASLLQAAGSDPLTVAWAREHELPRSQWTLPMEVATALHDADDE